LDLDNILQEFRKPYPERISLGLERINEILRLLGNPQDKYPSIHVAGTNGKGSVSAMLHSVFSNFNSRVGLFTSPHLERFTERIKINEQEIKEEEFVRILTEKVLPVIEQIDKEALGEPTEFEVLNSVAFCYFAEQNIDMAVVEVGLGGRLDSTNALKKVIASVITSISFDHTDRLGNTLKEIAGEKAGIIKPGVPVITSVLNPHPEVFIEKTDLVTFASPETIKIESTELNFNNGDSTGTSYPKAGYNVRYNENDSIFNNKSFFLPFIGKYQLENLALVLKTLEIIYQEKPLIRSANGNIFPVSQEDFISSALYGVSRTKWPGRFEIVNYDGMTLILDGAHNEEGMKEFTKTLKDFHGDRKIITIFACNKDKEHERMLDLLIPVTDYFILTESHVQIKAKDAAYLSEYLTRRNKDHRIVKDYRQTIKFAGKILSENNYNKEKVLINICGSLYLIGAIRVILNNDNSEEIKN
jgi:dihydrofolate synthase/folylpolyglutamate synthase